MEDLERGNSFDYMKWILEKSSKRKEIYYFYSFVTWFFTILEGTWTVFCILFFWFYFIIRLFFYFWGIRFVLLSIFDILYYLGSCCTNIRHSSDYSLWNNNIALKIVLTHWRDPSYNNINLCKCSSSINQQNNHNPKYIWYKRLLSPKNIYITKYIRINLSFRTLIG